MPAIPTTMTAVEISAPGDPEVLRPVERAVPEPGTGEVLIEVAAAGVNRPDVMQRRGHYPPPPGASEIPGLEVSGTVVATGRDVVTPRLGADVCALLTGGGYAEYCVAAAPLCLPVPEGLNMVSAAALPETYFTVWDNVFRRGRLRPGERVLVHGGASGIGTTAIQLARTAGATVLVTAGTKEKCWACEELGAFTAINYRDHDFVAEVDKLTHSEGVDLILDIVGGEYLGRNIEALAVDGRLVQIAVQLGARSQINLVPVMVKRLTITGSTLRARPVAEKAAIAAELLHNVWPWLEQRRVRPIVHSTFALRRAVEAHRLMDSGQHMGKIVLIAGDLP